MNWLKSLWSDAGKLHVTSDAVKVAALIAGLAVGFFGHDWAGAVVVMSGGIGVSLAASSQARSVTNSIGVAPDATARIPKS